MSELRAIAGDIEEVKPEQAAKLREIAAKVEALAGQAKSIPSDFAALMAYLRPSAAAPGSEPTRNQ